jgi:aminoglycoside phosphotransferase (APT) family kinase protein
MRGDDAEDRLTGWLRERMPSAENLRIEGSDQVTIGHSAEMIILTLVWTDGGAERRQDVVLRLRPPAPGLLEPYDMARQFTILRALEPTAVRSPGVRWLDEPGEVFGRPFYVMTRLDGAVYENEVPPELDARPELIARMSRGIIEQLAAIHAVDLERTGLSALGDGRFYLDSQLQHWAGEMHRVRRGELPALERLLAVLRERQPEPGGPVTLVHGDPKPANFAFTDGEVTAVFDWEMAGIGDPRADLGYLELLWSEPAYFTSRPSALAFEEAVAYYEGLTGITVGERAWYRSFQAFKTCVILLVGAMLFDAGHTDDLRFANMGLGIPHYTERALRDLGVPADLPAGPVRARRERFREVRDRLAGSGQR